MKTFRTALPLIGRIVLSPYAALILAALFWSGNFIVGRALKGEVPPVALNFWRWVAALAVLLPLSLGEMRRHRLLVTSHWTLFSGLGLTGIAAFHICVYAALARTTAINALIILSASPMVIVLISWALFRQGISRTQGLGLLVSLCGAIVLICKGNMAALVQLEFNRGDLWMLLAVPLWSVYSILLKHRPPAMPQIVLLTGSVMAGVILMAPVYLATLRLGETLPVNTGNILAILYISLFASVLAFFFWNRGVAAIGPVRAGMYIHFMPLFGAVLSICFLGEGLALFHLFGALLVGTGIFLTRGENRP